MRGQRTYILLAALWTTDQNLGVAFLSFGFSHLQNGNVKLQIRPRPCFHFFSHWSTKEEIAAARQTEGPGLLLLLLLFLSPWYQSSPAHLGAGRELHLFFSGFTLATEKNFNKSLPVWVLGSLGHSLQALSPPLHRRTFAVSHICLNSLTCLVLHTSELSLPHRARSKRWEGHGASWQTS